MNQKKTKVMVGALGFAKESKIKQEINGVSWREVPVLPGLEARFVEKKMERLPVIEDLVAVVNDVRCGAHVA